MKSYLIKAGNTLSGIAKQFGVTVKQLQDANNIKNANLIFAGDTLKIPDVESDQSFKLKGLSVESNPDNSESVSESSPKSENNGMKLASDNRQIGKGLTEDEVAKELDQMREPGQRVKPLNGETNEHLDCWRSTHGKETTMVCRDSSGKTADISGKFKIVAPDTYELNPEAFTITDNSSGSNHAYLYRKVGITDDGKLLYKCISMNGDEISTDNQYTLEWKKDGTPELVQYEHQDNYGSGLKVKKSKPTSQPLQTAN